MAAGKFQGVMIAHGPTGSLNVMIVESVAVDEGMVSP